MTEDRDHLKEEFESIKLDRERKLDDMRRQFEREKEILKTKNTDLQNKCKNTEAKQTELILAHEICGFIFDLILQGRGYDMVSLNMLCLMLFIICYELC